MRQGGWGQRGLPWGKKGARKECSTVGFTYLGLNPRPPCPLVVSLCMGDTGSSFSSVVSIKNNNSRLKKALRTKHELCGLKAGTHVTQHLSLSVRGSPEASPGAVPSRHSTQYWRGHKQLDNAQKALVLMWGHVHGM